MYGIMLGVLLAMTAAANVRPGQAMSQSKLSATRRACRSGGQFAGLLIFSSSLTFVGNCAAGRGLWPADPAEGGAPIDFLLSSSSGAAVAAVKPPEISVESALELAGTDVLFVDARDPSEFNAGHIRGAVLCPATDIGRWRIHLAGIAPDRRIIVYCAEAACGKGEYVASFLLKNGFVNVSLYREGWAKWTGPKEAK
jgi:rhodanese-related sulfurtransferase